MADARPEALTIDGHDIDVSRPDKVLFPADGVTKADLVDFYRRVADVMVPHLRDRPLMLQRLPDGLDGDSFVQKEAPDYFPGWIRRADMAKEGGTVRHVVCDDAATLAYLAAQACITPHRWLSRADLPDSPDVVVFDLDPPGPGTDFGALRSAARAVGDVLDAVGLVPFVQTTGSKGLHVVAPLDASTGYDTVRGFARDLADLVAAGDTGRLTTEQRKQKRRGRIYIDTMRNAYAQTEIAPYAVRALPGAPVATPLDWHELSRSEMHPQRYTLVNLGRRLARRTDPWAQLHQHAGSVDEARGRFDRVARDQTRRAG